MMPSHALPGGHNAQAVSVVSVHDSFRYDPRSQDEHTAHRRSLVGVAWVSIYSLAAPPAPPGLHTAVVEHAVSVGPEHGNWMYWDAPQLEQLAHPGCELEVPGTASYCPASQTSWLTQTVSFRP